MSIEDSEPTAARIDNLRDVKGVILLAATDRPERIEPALWSGRFDSILPFAKPGVARSRGDYSSLLPACALSPGIDFKGIGRRWKLHWRGYRKPVQKATLSANRGNSARHTAGAVVVTRGDFLLSRSS